MIPTFPNFKRLEWADRQEVEEFTKYLLPHSEFNFTSMWAWDTNEAMKLSRLNGNCVFLCNDCITGKHYLSFIGQTHINETTSALIEFFMKDVETGILRYVPEKVVENISDSRFKVTLDKDNTDYVLSTYYLANFEKHSGKLGQQYRKFLKLYSNIQFKINSLQEINKEELLAFFTKWAKNKNCNYLELLEYYAFERFIQIKADNIKVLSIYDKDEIIGFIEFEILSNSYSMVDFCKLPYKFLKIRVSSNHKRGYGNL